MSVGKVDLSGFQQNDAVSEAFDKTSGEDHGQNRLISVSGTYVMEVATFCFRNKKKNNDLVISPTLAPSSKGGINLVASLKVSEGFGTNQVAPGDYITVNIPVWPNPKASKEDVENMFRLAKPRLCALLGVENFKLDLNSLPEKFSTEWKEEEDGKFTMTKGHAMKSRVVCVFDDTLYNNRPSLQLVSMRKFKDGDKSISNAPSEQDPQQGFGSSQGTSDAEQGDLDFAAAGDSAASDAAPQTSSDQPETVEEDSLPF